jgi:elongation factor G
MSAQTYTTDTIRNVAIIGHSHTGKTSLVSAMLFDAGVVNRLCKVDDGNTTTDFDEDEQERKIKSTPPSLATTIGGQGQPHRHSGRIYATMRCRGSADTA